MKLEMQRYLHRPLFVDVVRVTEENMAEVAVWCDGKIKSQVINGHVRLYIDVPVVNPAKVRQSRAFVNDRVLQTEIGWKVYTPKAFEDAFVPVVDPRDETIPVFEEARVATEARFTANGEETKLVKVIGSQSGQEEREGVEEDA